MNMFDDIPGLTLGNFIAYFIPVTTVYLVCWVFFSWYGLKRDKRVFYWLILVVSAILVPYLLYLPFFKMPYMAGDDFYGYSFARSIANGNFLSDVCYVGYPTYYPPLYYLYSGILLCLSKLPLLKFFIYVPILNIIVVCVVAYFVINKIRDKETGVLFILMLFFVSVPGVNYLIRGMRVCSGIHFAIIRPYELIAVILMIYGIFLFSREKKNDKWWTGLISGIVTLLSISFEVPFALSLLVYSVIRAVRTKNYKTHFLRLVVVGFVTFFVSSIYTVPYLISVLRHGSDNYQWMWTILSEFDPYLVTFGLGFMGLVFVFGVLGIISLFQSNFRLILIITLAVLYIWRFHIYITKPLYNIKFISEQSYYALVIFLSFTGAIFLRDFPIRICFKKWTFDKLKIGHIFLASTFLLPILIWNPISNENFYNSFKPVPEKIRHLTDIINKKIDKDDIILASREISPWLLLLTGRKLALSGDPWCSNPAARYSLRFKDFSEAFSIDDIKVVKNNLNKWNVDIIVFVKEADNWGFTAGQPVFGMLRSPAPLRAVADKRIFSNNLYFEKLYEDDFYVVLRNKSLIQ